MGSRASQPLRGNSAAQVESNSTTNQSFPSTNGSAKTVAAAAGDALNNNNNNSHGNVNLNNGHAEAEDDVARIKESLNGVNNSEPATANGGSVVENNKNEAKQQQQQSNGKASTLQRQASSHIQSLAQRIKRSSSVRAPKLKSFLPAFINNKRKVSTTNRQPILQSAWLDSAQLG